MKAALIARAFAERLTALMKAKGLHSPTAKSGVDVTALSKAAGTTYEMARRYCEGNAIPRPEKLERIAEWLGTTATVLLYGEPEPGRSNRIIHTEVLQSCIAAARRAEELSGRKLSAEQMAKLVALLYDEALDGREISDGLIPRLLRLM